MSQTHAFPMCKETQENFLPWRRTGCAALPPRSASPEHLGSDAILPA
jgi:hypothetical protein